MKRYLISKGWEGFCDRLQCMSNCVTWAQLYNRVLYVDWNDRIWSHGDGGFYRYFGFADLEHVTDIHQIPKTSDICPPFWHNALELSLDDWIYKLKEELVFDPQTDRHYEQVWVHPGVGFRAFDFVQLVKHLRFQAPIAESIQSLLDRAPNDMPIVHLRGTDRPNTEEQWQAARSAAPVACIISDDRALSDRWMAESPDSVLFSDTLIDTKVGGHRLAQKELTEAGFSKYQMNLRLLADFILLAGAKNAVGLNENSLFFKMSRLFGACGGAEKIFLEDYTKP